MKSKYLSMSLFLLLIMLQLMRREHKHRTGILIGGLLKLNPWMDFWNISVKLLMWRNSLFQAWSGVRRAEAGWIAEQRHSTRASSSPILCLRIPDMSSPQPMRMWTMSASECGDKKSENEWTFIKTFSVSCFLKRGQSLWPASRNTQATVWRQIRWDDEVFQ